jgi:small subunit ribosomal protein S27Ae
VSKKADAKKTEEEKKPLEEKKAAEVPKEAPKEEAKPEKTAKPVKKKKPDKKIHTLFKIEQDKVVRLRPTCERCGPGYFMAQHKDRYTCGHCGFTKYKRGE